MYEEERYYDCYNDDYDYAYEQYSDYCQNIWNLPFEEAADMLYKFENNEISSPYYSNSEMVDFINLVIRDRLKERNSQEI